MMSGQISINPRKCEWGVYGMIYLGSIMFSGGKSIDLGQYP